MSPEALALETAKLLAPGPRLGDRVAYPALCLLGEVIVVGVEHATVRWSDKTAHDVDAAHGQGMNLPFDMIYGFRIFSRDPVDARKGFIILDVWDRT